MNILRPQTPYVFHPPQYRTWLGPFVKWVACNFILKRRFHVRSVTVRGAEAIKDLVKQKQSVLITPNHADHPDPAVVVHAARAHQFTVHFMAAREGFEKGPVERWFLRRAGAFSVDREGADVSAIKMAMSILEQGRFPLVIFPEGEIYHHHEELDVLNEGTATILLRTSERLRKKSKDSFVVPAAIRYGFDEAIEQTFSRRLTTLEERITWKPRPDMNPVERIYRLGSGLVALKEQEWLGETHNDDLPSRLARLSDALVQQIEEKHGEQNQNEGVPGRVKRLRRKIRKRLLDEEHPVTSEENRDLYDDLDTLFVAMQAYSYPGRYLQDHPTTARIAETLLKLEEDILGEGEHPGPCDASISFGEPINVQTYLQEHGLDAKSGAGPMTETLSRKIQKMLEEMARA